MAKAYKKKSNRQIRKQHKQENLDTHYFYSAISYDSEKNQCGYVNGIFSFGTEDAKNLNKNPFAFILKKAQEISKKTQFVHIVALNKL